MILGDKGTSSIPGVSGPDCSVASGLGQAAFAVAGFWVGFGSGPRKKSPAQGGASSGL
ncbi:hypothetical protein D3C80_176290 [compost metagenome]